MYNVNVTPKAITIKYARFTLSVNILFTLFITIVVGREAIRRPLDDVAIILQNAEADGGVLVGIEMSTDGPPCTIDIQRDLPKPNQPQPLYIQPDTTEWWLPNDQGIMEIPHGRRIELHCSSAFSNATKEDEQQESKTLPYKVHTIQPTCLSGTTFKLYGEKYEFRQFSCARHSKYTAERMRRHCNNNKKAAANAAVGELYRIGYNLTNGRFIETMQICHDAGEVRTHWTRHRMDARNFHSQRGVKRGTFSKVGHFPMLDMNTLYKLKNQRRQVALLLGVGDGDVDVGDNDDDDVSDEVPAAEQLFAAKSHFLSRGHLAAKSDMIYATQQRSTFNYFNVAPQWQSFNGGQWATLENQVRAFVAKEKLNVICYTGTWGTMLLNTIDDTLQRRQAFYLAADENNNGLLPVPALYYRVIVVVGDESGSANDKSRLGSGIALVGVNNPHAIMREIEEAYVLCEDVREQVPWLRWMAKNGVVDLKKGYLYACRVAEFVKVVAELPAELAHVTELLV